MESREESAILGLVKRHSSRIFSLGELAREAALPEGAVKDAAESLVCQGLLARTLRGNYCMPAAPDTEDLPAGAEIVCPFCHLRRAFAPAESPSPFSPLGQIEVYQCPCGAVASPSADAIYGKGYELEEVEQALLTSVRGAEAEASHCHADLTHIARTDPPILLLWVKPLRRDSGRTS